MSIFDLPVGAEEAGVRALADQRFPFGVGQDPLVLLQEQDVFGVCPFPALHGLRVGALRQDDDALEAFVGDAAGRQVQGGLVHLDGRALRDEEDRGFTAVDRVVLDVPHMAEHQTEVGGCDVDLGTFMVFKTVIGRVSSVAVADLDRHAAVEVLFHIAHDREAFHLGHRGDVRFKGFNFCSEKQSERADSHQPFKRCFDEH